METPDSLAAPRTIEVPVAGGAHRLRVSPWSMAQHDECFPLVVVLLEHWAESTKAAPGTVSLGEMITLYKTEVTRLCRITVAPELFRLGLDWDKDLWGEDLFGIADAIWQTSLVRPGGGGVLG